MPLPTTTSAARPSFAAVPERLARYVAAPRLHRAEIAALRERAVRPRRTRPVVTPLSRRASREAPRRRPPRPGPPQVVPVPGASSSAVYLLLHAQEPRFKLGWSLNPRQRIAMLPEHREAALDLDRSRVVWLPDRQRAEEVERSMHKLLRPFSVEVDHCEDGYTEWFAATVWNHAVELLSRVPLNDDPARLARVHTLGGVWQDVMAPVTAPGSVRDTWSRIDDLLRRIALSVPLQLERAADGAAGPLLRLVGIRLQWAGELAELRRVVVDAETWQHRSAGRVHAFLQWFDYDRDDLLLQFMPLQLMASWDEELHLPTQVSALLHHLVAQQAQPVVPSGGVRPLDA